MQFPQVSADLSVRWCSAYLKIDVASKALCNQDRFDNKRTLFVTGERAQEAQSPKVANDRSKWVVKGRAAYAEFEPHRSDLRDGRTPRHIDHWRPVLQWMEERVWETIRRHGVNPHPAYRLGWGRTSCAACIFGSPNQWASLRAVNPEQFGKVAGYEQQFGKTIQRKLTVIQQADRGVPYRMDPAAVAAALSPEYTDAVILPEGEWKLPAGAFGESCGPI